MNTKENALVVLLKPGYFLCMGAQIIHGVELENCPGEISKDHQRALETKNPSSKVIVSKLPTEKCKLRLCEPSIPTANTPMFPTSPSMSKVYLGLLCQD